METKITLLPIAAALKITAFEFSCANKPTEIRLVAEQPGTGNAHEIEKIRAKLADEWKTNLGEIKVSSPKAELVVSFNVSQELVQTF
jgi:fumarylacetoacetate (FAA) hydrolase family protein